MNIIPGFPNYFATEDGRIWSTKGRGRFLKLFRRSAKVPYLGVNLHRGNQQVSMLVHTLVAMAFLGPRPQGFEARHLDGNSSNNSVRNLAYGTKSENTLDMVAHGTHHAARKTHCDYGHRLTPENVYVSPSKPGHRYCRQCRTRRLRESRSATRQKETK